MATFLKQRKILGSALQVFAGLWGMSVVLIFSLSVFQMTAPQTPTTIFFQLNVTTLAFLGLQGIFFVCLFVSGLWVLLGQSLPNGWSKLLAVLSTPLLAISLFPWSSMGPVNLPATLSAFVGSVLLARQK